MRQFFSRSHCSAYKLNLAKISDQLNSYLLNADFCFTMQRSHICISPIEPHCESYASAIVCIWRHLTYAFAVDSLLFCIVRFFHCSHLVLPPLFFFTLYIVYVVQRKFYAKETIHLVYRVYVYTLISGFQTVNRLILYISSQNVRVVACPCNIFSMYILKKCIILLVCIGWYVTTN